MAVTERRAQAVLRQVEDRFSAWFDSELPAGIGEVRYYGPKLVRDWDGIPYVIIWEEGPYDWTIAFTSDDSTEEERALLFDASEEFGFDYRPPKVKPRERVKGVFAEPVTGSVLGLYPD